MPNIIKVGEHYRDICLMDVRQLEIGIDILRSVRDSAMIDGVTESMIKASYVVDQLIHELEKRASVDRQ